MINSHSQYEQESYNHTFLNNKTNGIFVEVGGMDGIRHSNTYMLEKDYNWNGLIIEPSPSLFKLLNKNRNCFKENILVGDKFDIVNYLYIEDDKGPDGLQGVYDNYEEQHIKRINKELKETNTISQFIKLKMVPIQQLFDKYNLNNIDYFSLDVEGSELQVLNGIDFNKTNINIFSI